MSWAKINSSKYVGTYTLSIQTWRSEMTNYTRFDTCWMNFVLFFRVSASHMNLWLLMRRWFHSMVVLLSNSLWKTNLWSLELNFGYLQICWRPIVSIWKFKWGKIKFREWWGWGPELSLDWQSKFETSGMLCKPTISTHHLCLPSTCLIMSSTRAAAQCD